MPEKDKSDIFFDSLKVRASKKKFTRLIYDFVVTGYKPPVDVRAEALKNYSNADGKILGSIGFKRLDVFGPSIQDTARKATSWLEKAGNSVHTRSDLNNLRKNLIIKPGEVIDSEILYENERIFRTLPRLRDAKFIVIPDSINEEVVHLLLITQDRFSIGVTGNVDGTSSGKAEIYNRNVFGLGHEASVRFVGHLTRKPYLGLETMYRISNINGKFLGFQIGYLNTFRSDGAVFQFEKPLITTTDKFAYGLRGYTYKRTSELPELTRRFRDIELQYKQMGAWGARNYQLGDKEHPHSQLTLAAMFTHRDFKDRPLPPEGETQYFSNRNMYTTGITWSQRSYIPDKLVYGYGITEDIPKGFKNELVVGYDNNENGPRGYSHIFLSNGNFLPNKPGYLYFYAGAGGYLQNKDYKQGLIEGGINYISKLHGNGAARFRHFIKVDYMKGVSRYSVENLTFDRNDLIRGFDSKRVSGKERLNINIESVYFQRKEFYRFNIAFFTFADLGIIGNSSDPIFTQNYYGGFGAGMRLHNESLVLKTILIRLAVYPNHPKDVGLLGFLVVEQTRQHFYNFQPGPPEPRRFQ